MHPRHGFRHSNETDPNEPKQNYWVHKSGFGTFVSFLDESVHRFISGPDRCIKCNTCFWHSNETDPNEPKHQYWVQKAGLGAFVLFLDESVHRFISGPDRCIKCNTGMIFVTVTKLTQMNQNITIGSKKVDWVRSFCFWMNRCIVSFPARIGALNATPAWFSAQ